MSFELLKSRKDSNRYEVADADTGLVLRFNKGDFNNSQTIAYLNDKAPDAMIIARTLREMADWLIENHPELL